jgi:hypothetical protein
MNINEFAINFGSIKIVFSDSAARVGTKEYPTIIGEDTVVINRKDEEIFLSAVGADVFIKYV